MNNNPRIINKIPSTLFQQLLSATSTVERQVILKKYNELSLSTPTTLTEITQSKYLKWMDDFIESMNSMNRQATNQPSNPPEDPLSGCIHSFREPKRRAATPH